MTVAQISQIIGRQSFMLKRIRQKGLLEVLTTLKSQSSFNRFINTTVAYTLTVYLGCSLSRDHFSFISRMTLMHHQNNRRYLFTVVKEIGDRLRQVTLRRDFTLC